MARRNIVERYIRADIEKRVELILNKDVPVNSFVLRDEKNDITNNYVSNFYIKRDKYAKPIDKYFVIRKAKDGKFYALNPSNNELYLEKYKSNKKIAITNKDKGFDLLKRSAEGVRLLLSPELNATINEIISRGMVFSSQQTEAIKANEEESQKDIQKVLLAQRLTMEAYEDDGKRQA